MASESISPVRENGYENTATLERDKRLHKLAVYSSVVNTGNYSKTFNHGQNEILFSNDADKETPPLQLDTSMTVRLTGAAEGLDLTFKIYYGEVLDERINGFDTIEVTANYGWRFITRSTVVV